MLIPPDKKQCQVDIPTDHNFMTLGPRKKYRRCENKPVVILHEKVEGTDGLKGSMSVCPRCMQTASEQLQMSDYRIESLN